MPDLAKKEAKKRIIDLIQQAEEEELKYNWDEEIEVLRKAEKISIDHELKEDEGDISYKLGEIYGIAADFGKTQEAVINSLQSAIECFERAAKIFEALKIENKSNAASGQVRLFRFISGVEKGKEKLMLESAREFFNKAKTINLEKGNLKEALIMAISEIGAFSNLFYKISFSNDKRIDPIKLLSEYETLSNKVWDDIKNFTDIPEIYFYKFLIYNLTFSFGMTNYFPIKDFGIQRFSLDLMGRYKEIMDSYENSGKNLILLQVQIFYAGLNASYATFFTDNQFEMKKYYTRGLKSLKKAEIWPQKLEINNYLKVYFYITRFIATVNLMFLGYSTRNFKTYLEDYDRTIEHSFLLYPRYMGAFYSIHINLLTLMFIHAPVIPDMERLNIAKKSLKTLNLMVKNIPVFNDPSNILINLQKDTCISSVNAILGDLAKEEKERSDHLHEASKIFQIISRIETEKGQGSFFYAGIYYHASRTAMILANNTAIISKQVEYYQKATDLLLISKDFLLKDIFYSYLLIEYLILIPSLYYKIARLTNDNADFKKAYLAYIDAIKYYEYKGYSNLIGLANVRIAQIEDRLGNFLSAAEYYQKAVDSYERAILTLTYTRLVKNIETLKNYLKAWNLIEIAKAFHVKEEHERAQLHYEQASKILGSLRDFKYEAPFYIAWATLENAEGLSKKNQHQESASRYLKSKNEFGNAIEIFNSNLGKRTISQRDKDRISKLIKVAVVRERYCDARFQIETARLESKKGNHLTAAELYNKSSSLFENLCHNYKIEREKDELTAVYYLCKAWESLERADEKQVASLYGSAAELFKKASNMFPESRMQKLSIGNSLYCSALQCGSLFDKTTNLDDKIKFYKKIKMHLRDSSRNYQLGGFEQDAQWALATSTFFDGLWHLIQADNELDAAKKDQFLGMATKYLKNALSIFENAGYEEKRKEIINYIEMVNQEKMILASALSVIEKPAIAGSSVGISAPSCPIEISSSVSVGEMQRTDLQTEAELNWRKRIHHIYFYTSDGGCIYDQSFTVESDVSPSLVAGGLTGVDALMQEVTQTESKIKIIEKEDMTVLLEHGEHVSVALVTEENLITLRNKLKQSVQEIEDFFKEELARFTGNITPFQKIGKFVQKIFEN